VPEPTVLLRAPDWSPSVRLTAPHGRRLSGCSILCISTIKLSVYATRTVPIGGAVLLLVFRKYEYYSYACSFFFFSNFGMILLSDVTVRAKEISQESEREPQFPSISTLRARRKRNHHDFEKNDEKFLIRYENLK
jgi:hypothetical protein